MGMTFQQFYAAIDRQVGKTVACSGHEAFRRDIEQLKRINTGFGLPSITANVWLKQLCELSDADLISYVERYQVGTLDALTEHYYFVGKKG